MVSSCAETLMKLGTICRDAKEYSKDFFFFSFYFIILFFFGFCFSFETKKQFLVKQGKQLSRIGSKFRKNNFPCSEFIKLGRFSEGIVGN